MVAHMLLDDMKRIAYKESEAVIRVEGSFNFSKTSIVQ